LNADREIAGNDSKFELINGNARLLVERLAPSAASTEIVDLKVQARGLPGSVDKGDSEIRGRQLRVTTKAETTDGGFLHVLVPSKAEVSPVTSVVKIEGGIRVTLANGRSDTICLGTACGGAKNPPGRVVIRRGDTDALVFQRPAPRTAKFF
jgi:hypothetical protein